MPRGVRDGRQGLRETIRQFSPIGKDGFFNHFKSDVEIAEFSKRDSFNDCIMDNEMAARRKVIQDKCDSLLSNASKNSPQGIDTFITT